MYKTIITITGIRPDFIRMSEIFKKLDENFNHILIHTGQHFDRLLSDVFFEELNIRKPDYNLEIGGVNKEHFHQSAELSVKIIELFRSKNINPDLILFLGDSNSVTSALPLKKEGYKIGHIEAGMRSGDKRMLEEINRIVCDHCSDYHFVYHDNYKNKLLKENIDSKNIFVVGNTIVEPVLKILPKETKKLDRIILDIHRPENFKYKNRLKNIINMTHELGAHFSLPIKMLGFNRTINYIKNFDVFIPPNIEIINLLSFKEYINNIFHSKFIVSDSGTAQEEPALLNTPVLVPRDYTERPESYNYNCSFKLDVENINTQKADIIHWINTTNIDSSWLGKGNTSQFIIDILKEIL